MVDTSIADEPKCTKEVSILLGVGIHRLSRAAWLGQLTPTKGPGGSFLWRRADIEAASRLLRHRGLDTAEEAVLAAATA